MKKERTKRERPAALPPDGRIVDAARGCVCTSMSGTGVFRIECVVDERIFSGPGSSVVSFWSYPARVYYDEGKDEVGIAPARRPGGGEKTVLPEEAKNAVLSAVDLFREDVARIEKEGVSVDPDGDCPVLCWKRAGFGKVDAFLKYRKEGEEVTERVKSRPLREIVDRFLSLEKKDRLYGEWYPFRVPAESDRILRAAVEAGDRRSAREILRVRRRKERRLARRGYRIVPSGGKGDR